jgi:UDP-N-acetylglucosamine 2-epimerase (non-hydrolysing)/GDP/UDP-N,N'-diacetylbacillosamine 2-epimerase (hydrolysing)
MGDAVIRRILYISGSRADYGPARRVLKAIETDPDLELEILVCGMHLDPLHGETWREITEDGLTIIEKLPVRQSDDSLADMASAIGAYFQGLSHAISRIQPDLVLVLGDRGEQLAGAMAAAFQNITVAHLCGGSLSGSIDDSIRHAITKFAHYHLPGFEEHAQRIIQMGEDPRTVCVVGLPGGDINPDVTLSRAQVCSEFGLPFDELYLLVVQHPVTQSHSDVGAQITETLEAVASTKLQVLLANPNDDAGGRVILKAMEEYSSLYSKLRVLPPLGSRERFASVMAHAAALVGNSSSALVEAMSVGLPVVNIGERQRGREHLSQWINAGHDRTEVAQAIAQAMEDEAYQRRVLELKDHIVGQDTEALVLTFLKELDVARGGRPKSFFEGNKETARPA